MSSSKLFYYAEPEMKISRMERVFLVEAAKNALLWVYSVTTNLPITANIYKNFKSIQVGHHNLPIPGKFYSTASMIHQYLCRKSAYVPLKDWPVKHLIQLIRDCYGTEYTHYMLPASIRKFDTMVEEYKQATGSSNNLNEIHPQQRIYYLPTPEGYERIDEIHNALRRGNRIARNTREARRHNRPWTRKIRRQIRQLEDDHTNGRATAERLALVQKEDREEDQLQVILAVEEATMDSIMNILGGIAM